MLFRDNEAVFEVVETIKRIYMKQKVLQPFFVLLVLFFPV
jgi:hypothetical protein